MDLAVSHFGEIRYPEGIRYGRFKYYNILEFFLTLLYFYVFSFHYIDFIIVFSIFGTNILCVGDENKNVKL